MGKGGGKGGKSGLGKALGIVGFAAGFAFPGAFGITNGLLWVQRATGAIMGLALGQTIGSALDPIDQDVKASSFDSKMNTVDSEARIPLVYGTRMIGGLQSWHQSNTDDKWLIKDVILGEGQFSGAYGITGNGYLMKPKGDVPTVIRQYTTANHYMSTISSGNNPVFGLINWKYPSATVEIRNGGPTDNDKKLILRWGNNNVSINLQDPVDLEDDSSNDYSCSFSLLYQYLEGIHYDTNFAAEGWQLVNPVCISDPPEDLAVCGQTGCYQSPVMFRLNDYDATKDSWVQFYDGTQGPPEYYEKSGAYPNMAYLHAYLKYSEKLGSGNPTITCIAHGRKIHDTRTGKTDYSENPAMIVRDFLVNKTFGAGHFVTADMLDEDSFKDVADYCDEIITSTDGAGRSITEPRYRLNIVVNEKQTYLETLQNMLACFAGFLVFTNGKVALKVERAESAVYAFNDDNIVADSISYKADSTADSPNRYNVKYIEPNLNWTAVPVIVEDLVSQATSPIGRGKIISKDVELVGVTSQSQASRLGKIYRDLVRLCPITMTFKTGMQGMHLEPGDIVLVSHKVVVDKKETDLFKDMPVRILQIQDDNGEYTLTCRQYNASIYDDRFGSNLQLHSYTTIKPGDEDQILPVAVPQPENLHVSTIYKQGPDGAVKYDLVVTFDLPDGYGLETGLVYYKTNEDYDLENVGVIEEGVQADEIGFAKDWKYAGDGPGQFVFNNVNLGVTYKIMVRSRNINGGMSSEVGAPTETITIERKTEVPNIPNNFSVIFGEGCQLVWEAVTNSDVDFYEVRGDENAGSEDGLIARTTGTSINVTLTERTGTLYLFAHNATKQYGYPAVLEYSKEKPPTPEKPKLTTKLGGFSIEAEPIPDGCSGMSIYISAGGSDNTDSVIYTQNNVYSYMCDAGIYDVQIAYKDIFGEGDKSAISSILVKVLVDNDFLADEAVSVEKIDKVVQDAIDQGIEAKNQVVQLVGDLNSEDGASKYSALVQLEDAINLRVRKDDVINQINISPESILIDGSKVHVTGDTVFDNNVITNGMIQAGAISTDKLAAQDIAIGVDPTTGIVGGAVRLDENGLTVTSDNGTSVVFDENGMSFKDSHGSTFSSIGRFCTGVVKDGDTVTFNTPWDVIPTVFLFPTDLQTSAVGYSNVNIYQQVTPTNVSEKGFSAICRSILKSGSNSQNIINNKFVEYPTNYGQDYSGEYSFTIPSSATQIELFLYITSKAERWRIRHPDNTYNTWDSKTWTYLTITTNNATLLAETQVDYVKNSENTLNYNRTFSIKGATKVTVKVRWHAEDDYPGDETNGFHSSGSATVAYYKINVTADTVISQGTAGFVAVDPNSCPFTVS